MKSTLDPLELQRLVDGRLTRSERSAFLDGLNNNSAQWRIVALAFVEDQLLRDAFRATAPLVVDAPADSPRPATRSPNRASGWLTTIALTAFALVIGVLLGNANRAAKPANSRADRSERRAPTPDAIENKSAGDYYVVVTPPAVATSTRPRANRAADGDAFDTLATPIFDRQSREAVRKHGFRVDEEPVLYMISDGKGGQYMIPQRRIEFVPETGKRK